MQARGNEIRIGWHCSSDVSSTKQQTAQRQKLYISRHNACPLYGRQNVIQNITHFTYLIISVYTFVKFLLLIIYQGY